MADHVRSRHLYFDAFTHLYYWGPYIVNRAKYCRVDLNEGCFPVFFRYFPENSVFLDIFL